MVAGRAEMRDPAHLGRDPFGFGLDPAGAPVLVDADEREPVAFGQPGDILALGE